MMRYTIVLELGVDDGPLTEELSRESREAMVGLAVEVGLHPSLRLVAVTEVPTVEFAL